MSECEYAECDYYKDCFEYMRRTCQLRLGFQAGIDSPQAEKKWREKERAEIIEMLKKENWDGSEQGAKESAQKRFYANLCL